MRLIAISLVFWSATVWASSGSIGPDGINSKSTNFDGTGIEIGQVERLRPGKYGHDPNGASASNTIPAQVYWGLSVDGASSLYSPVDNPGGHIGPHPTGVAGVMIGKPEQGLYEGVAPNANLHSVGFGGGSDTDAAYSINRIATLTGLNNKMRAINLSFGREIQDFIEDTDGMSHLTSYVDWSARRYDILYAVAWGNDVDPEKRKPTDNYNGITVAASEQIEPPFGEVYEKFGSINNTQGDAAGDRTSISLLAPGAFVPILGPGDTEILDADGTSGRLPMSPAQSLSCSSSFNSRLTDLISDSIRIRRVTK